MIEGVEALTEKEKQTLRLLLAGHDAKSMARHLDLSVHTINDRLRDARRKLAVSSSKEAARLLRQFEGAPPQNVGYTPFGDAAPAPIEHLADRPSTQSPARRRTVWAIGGCAMISILFAALALLAPAQGPQTRAEAPGAVAARAPGTDPAAVKAAQDWLALVDAENWQESWAATGRSFRSLNTLAVWRSASERARLPLGRVLSRTLADEQDVPAPPNGYRMVRFHTDFANRPGATETLSLDRESDGWKVVGVYIE